MSDPLIDIAEGLTLRWLEQRPELRRYADSADVARLLVPREGSAPQDGIASAREDRHPVPCALALPNGLIAGALDLGDWEGTVLRLQFLRADNVGLGVGQTSPR